MKPIELPVKDLKFTMTRLPNFAADFDAVKYRYQVMEKMLQFMPSREVCVELTMTTQSQHIGPNLISPGVLYETIVHIREVFRVAIAFGVVLMHKHPSCDTNP